MELLSHLEKWQSHGNSQYLGFFRTGDDTAIVIGKDNHGFTLEGRLEDTLTRDVKIVAVHQGECRRNFQLASDRVDDMGHHTPDLKIRAFCDVKWLIVAV